MSAPVRTEPDFVAFHPKPPVRVDWPLVSIVAAAIGGVLMGAWGLAILFERAAPPFGLRATHGMDILGLAFLLGAGPFAVVHYVRRKHILERDARLPDFLTDLASLHKAGLTLPESLLTAAEGDYGALTKEVRWAAEQVKWDIPVLIALDNFRRRLGTPIAERTLTVVLEAGRSGGNVPDVMEVAANNARAFIKMRDQRARSMGLYTLITYVASLVFISVTLALQGLFVPKMIHAFGGTAGSSLPLAKEFPSADSFRNLFLASAMVQAVGNGLVGGVMSDGRALAGLKHGWTMVLMTLLGFALAG